MGHRLSMLKNDEAARPLDLTRRLVDIESLTYNEGRWARTSTRCCASAPLP